MAVSASFRVHRLEDFLAQHADLASSMQEALSHIEAPALVFPGLVNSHDHLEFNLFNPVTAQLFDGVVSWSEFVHGDMVALE